MFSGSLCVGTITKPHGYSGSVVIRAQQGCDADMLMWDVLLVKINGGLVPFTVIDVKSKNDNEVIAQLKYVESDVKARELVCGCDVYILKKWLSEDSAEGLESDELDGETFHVSEFVGYTVIDSEDGNPIGEIVDVDLSVAENPLFVLSNNNLIPIVEDWVVDLNHGSKTITLTLPSGLI